MKRVFIGDVIDNNSSLAVPVVDGSQSVVPLLACSVLEHRHTHTLYIHLEYRTTVYQHYACTYVCMYVCTQAFRREMISAKFVRFYAHYAEHYWFIMWYEHDGATYVQSTNGKITKFRQIGGGLASITAYRDRNYATACV